MCESVKVLANVYFNAHFNVSKTSVLPITTLPYPSSSPRPVPNVRRTNPWKSLKVLESPFTLIPASPLPMSVERTLESPWKSFYFNTSVSSPASMFCSSTTVPTCESACVYAIVIFRGSAWSSACDSWTYKLQSACENVQPACSGSVIDCSYVCNSTISAWTSVRYNNVVSVWWNSVCPVPSWRENNPLICVRSYFVLIFYPKRQRSCANPF